MESIILREAVVMGWDALNRWGGDVARIERLQTGLGNDVCSVRINGHLAVGRLGGAATRTSRGRPNSYDTLTAKG